MEPPRSPLPPSISRGFRSKCDILFDYSLVIPEGLQLKDKMPARGLPRCLLATQVTVPIGTAQRLSLARSRSR